ncbi:unnamed protein product, partial [Meganyctiphanes norvegica]
CIYISKCIFPKKVGLFADFNCDTDKNRYSTLHKKYLFVIYPMAVVTYIFSLSHILTHSLSLSLIFSLTLSLSLSLSHSLTHSHPHSLTHSHTHYLPLSLTLTHTLNHSISVSLSHAYNLLYLYILNNKLCFFMFHIYSHIQFNTINI